MFSYILFSSSEAVIKIFLTTLSLAFDYDTVGVGFCIKLSTAFFSQHLCSINITNGHTVLQKTF